ncbi:MAG: hypothetical protein M3Y68_06890, partial [Chloroflexota bacterium]|nr:hypothetical protein [Chloroflexota bacterium]
PGAPLTDRGERAPCYSRCAACGWFVVMTTTGWYGKPGLKTCSQESMLPVHDLLTQALDTLN